MSKLNRYLIVMVTKILLLCQFAGIAVFSIIEFFEHMDVFTSSLQQMAFGILYLCLKIPYYFNLILPLAFLISILILIILMIRSNEVLIIRTSRA